MIIDSHTHIGRNEHISATVDELLRSMDKAGITKSLVFAGELNDCPNEWMLEQIAPHKDRLLGVAAYTPPGFGQHYSADYTRENIINLYGEGKIVAIKFYTGYDHYYPIDLRNMLPALEEVGCPAIFHCGDCLNSVKCAKLKYSHPLHIDEVAVDFPGMNFIIAHMGYPWHRDAGEVCYKNKNVFADISGFVYGDFTDKNTRDFSKVITEFIDVAGGTNQMLFGSDWPISNQESYIKTMYGFPLDGMEYIMSGNVKRAFKLA